MVTRAQLVTEARTWVGTPFRHQGRVKGVGCDCAGLIVGLAKHFQLSTFDVLGYNRHPTGRVLVDICDAEMERIAIDEMAPGDVALLRFERDPQHLALIGNYLHGGLSLIHSYVQGGGVVEHRLDSVWARRIVAAYRIPGVI